MKVEPRTLAVVGTLVYDRIVPVDGPPVERWGGIGYSAAAAAATLPPGWSVRLVAKVGSDLADAAADLAAALPRTTPRLRPVPEPNNRVELRYRDEANRTEHLTGGVPGWSADELLEELEGCDAVLVNFIAGWELDLPAARSLADGFAGPRYADLHSLFLGRADDGTRVPRRLPDWKNWVEAFDAVQMNEDELALLTGRSARSHELPEVLEAGPSLVAVTRGGGGASVAWRPPFSWRRSSVAGGTRAEVREVTLGSPRRGDPTGCGDVWGAVMCARLLGGATVPQAADTANRVAAASMDHLGVEGLAERLADVPLDGGAGAYLESTGEVER